MPRFAARNILDSIRYFCRMAKNKVILHLGSNVGNRIRVLQRARTLIQQKVGPISASSALYETEAWGYEDQDDFINQVVIAQTPLRPIPCLHVLHNIEQALGRKRQQHWGPRLIDIDILFYEQLIIHLPELAIPHPGIPNRNFVLVPLIEVAPDLYHPVLEKDMRTLLDISPDEKKVVRLDEE